MTNHVKPHQGEGSGGRALADVIGPAARWSSMPMFPAQCVRVEVVVHQEPGEAVYGYAIEVSDPHTRELLAKAAHPTKPYSVVRSIAATISLDVRALLMDVMDPDPF